MNEAQNHIAAQLRETAQRLETEEVTLAAQDRDWMTWTRYAENKATRVQFDLTLVPNPKYVPKPVCVAYDGPPCPIDFTHLDDKPMLEQVARDLLAALMHLTYATNGTVCVGIRGDAEVPDEVRAALVAALKFGQILPTSLPTTWTEKDLISLVGRAGLEPATKGL